MHYLNVILLSDVIWAFGPKVTRRVTYIYLWGMIQNNHLQCQHILFYINGTYTIKKKNHSALELIYM